MSSAQDNKTKGLIAWFACNPVAANLLLLIIAVAGIASAVNIRKQTTPDFELNVVDVRVPYPGASPPEVEAGVVRRVEEAVQDATGIKSLTSTAFEGLGVVSVEVSRDANIDQVLANIKTRVDSIITFPAEAERPVVYKREQVVPVLFVALYGDFDEFVRKELAENLRDKLIALPEVNNVEILGQRDYEISIEVSEATLREYGLSIREISSAIQEASVDLPGGMLATSSGDILLRTAGQVYRGYEFADLVLRSNADGTRLTLGEIATITDGFVETDGFSRFNRQPASTLRILAGGEQNELATSAAVKAVVEQQRATLPEGITLDVWVERALYLQGRLDMMTKNMLQGAILVFLVLTLFLRLRVAFWVIVGIPFAFLGALTLMPVGPWPVTVNTISLFGFILVLGIVVDDAIIIGESIYSEVDASGHTLDNVVRGARRVATTATFGVLTTIAAFVPLLFVDGLFAPYLEAISVVVILCLIFSLIESKLILPAHLANDRFLSTGDANDQLARGQSSWWGWPHRLLLRCQAGAHSGLRWFVSRVYRPLLVRAIHARGLTLAMFVALLIVTMSLVQSGQPRVVLFPQVPGDYVRLDLQMQAGTAPERRSEALDAVERSLYESVNAYMDEHAAAIEPVRHVTTFTEGNSDGAIIVELPMTEDRPLDNQQVSELWRAHLPDLPGVRRISFSDATNLGGGPPISIGLSGDNETELLAAARALVARLAQYDGVYDVTSDATSGGEEIRLNIKPEAEALGITLAALARQVREAFYGEEAQRIQRGRDEVNVVVRYPRSERRSVTDLLSMQIQTPSGERVPFESVAEVEFAQAFSSINRVERRRTISVWANADLQVAEPGKIVSALQADFMPELLARYPTVSARRQGSSEQEEEVLRVFKVASLAAILLIFSLIAIPLKSYVQPLLIMSVIPFGLVGAVVGHIVTGNALSIFSIFGLIALAGVVVNDSLIMLDFINTARRQGTEVIEAVVQSGVARFRAIVLTSLTTAFGLLPIVFETSVQAQFVVPMAVSMSFGILFATVITLFLVPVLYLMHIDVLRVLRRIGWFVTRAPR